MSNLSELKPTKKERVYDLLERVGIRVPSNRNQNFLSRPAFQQGKKVVVNFWYRKQIKPQGEDVVVKWRLPATGEEISPRMKMVHNAIKSAIERNLRIRIIVLDGKMGNANTPSKVSKRSLDSMYWSVKTYNEKTGKCVLVRDIHADNRSRIENESAIDDLSDVPEGSDVPDRAKVVTEIIKRKPEVRAYVIKRANGKCEYCNVQGFRMKNGGFYLEAHHVIELSKTGPDRVDNVIALCPLHHRQAHYGADGKSIEAEFTEILKKLNRNK